MLVAVVVAGTALVVCFFGFLALCAFIVVRTGKTDGLRDFAIAMQAFTFSVGRFGFGRTGKVPRSE